MFSVSRPIEVVVLNAWVTETNETPLRSNTSTSLAKSISERRQPVDLVDHHDVDLPASMSASSRFSAGRSSVPPEKPPSS